MKVKKALKRLAKAETLLTNVIDQYPAGKNGLKELLDSAKTSLAQARAAMDLEVTPPPKKAPAKARESKQSRLSEAGRKRISAAAKKRWAVARRKGVNAVTGDKLKKSA
ncbi:conserved hypothetical protein [Candidatus Sulfopaludibacter sp. SbA3]|nr:conserved hypothetical protein [Candidatus Sulfopaludibacter sp. SbA3]